MTAASGLVRGTPGYRALTLAMLLSGFSTFSLLYSLQPLLPVFARQFALSAEASSLAISIATAPLAIGILVAGALSDRIGRRAMMVWAMFLAEVLTILLAAAPGWHAILALRFLTGIVLSGVPAVAIAYIAEEIDPLSVGAAMGLYVAGNAIGGMAGRLELSLATGLIGWRWSIAGIGLIALVMAEAFRRLAPPSRGFVARADDPRETVAGIARLFRDAALPWLYLEAFLLMGAFVTIYNYAGFRLEAPPYGLGHAAVGAVFLLYILGSFSSAWFGRLAGGGGRRLVFWVPIVILLGGIAVSAARPLPLVILGIALATTGFFGAHSIAASWVGRRAMAARGQAAALYLFFYYLGSSVLGSAGGVAWSRAGWAGVAWFCAGLAALALAGAGRLYFVPPIPGAEVEPPPVVG